VNIRPIHLGRTFLIGLQRGHRLKLIGLLF